jgi:hypothetical protein
MSSGGEEDEAKGYLPFRVVPRGTALSGQASTSETVEPLPSTEGAELKSPSTPTVPRQPPVIRPKPTDLLDSPRSIVPPPTQPSGPISSKFNTSTPTSSPSRTWKPTGTPGSASRTPGGGGDTCPACEKRVYLMEAVTALSVKWHKWCLKVSPRSRSRFHSSRAQYMVCG